MPSARAKSLRIVICISQGLQSRTLQAESFLAEAYSRPAGSPYNPDTWATGNLQSCNRIANGNRLAPQTQAALALGSRPYGEPGTSLVRPLHLHCCASNEAQSQYPNLDSPLVNGRSP